MLEIVTRERLKNILRQYDLRETHWISILKSKELELLLAKARLETAQKKAAQVVGSSGNGQSEVTATASPREVSCLARPR
jgi:predicted RNA-binding protein with PUA domain